MLLKTKDFPKDRTHVFKLHSRLHHDIPDNINIENVQVRGKRGNIVQTFPAVEYDFTPQAKIRRTLNFIKI